ncbi:MAG: hypothetical protein ACLQGP_06235 [Isosphaeraceae bacterium]
MRLSRTAALTIAVGIALGGSTGCMAVRLGQRTMHQASTLPDLQYQQVLDNLAMFADNPSALPWHVNFREGTTQVTDSASAGAAVDLGPPSNTLPQLFGSRTIVVQWGMTPVIERTELRLLRIAYRRALGLADMPDPEFLSELTHELKNQFPSNSDQHDESELFYELESSKVRDYAEFDAKVVTTNDGEICADGPDAIPRNLSPLARNVCRKVESVRRDLARIGPGWFHVGRKRDVPRDACYVGRHGDRYAWVGPEGREALTEFTLTVMNFSTLIKETQTLISPGSVKFSPGDRGGG